MKAKQAIESIQLGSDHIAFLFACFWYHEDVELLSGKIFNSLSSIRVLEVIEGADRCNTRFVWQEQYYFSLSFDCYSQSCWLEGEDEVSNEQLKRLNIYFESALG